MLATELWYGLEGLPRRFYIAASKVLDVPWSMAATGDLRFPGVTGHRGSEVRVLNAYLGRLQVAAPPGTTPSSRTPSSAR